MKRIFISVAKDNVILANKVMTELMDTSSPIQEAKLLKHEIWRESHSRSRELKQFSWAVFDSLNTVTPLHTSLNW